MNTGKKDKENVLLILYGSTSHLREVCLEHYSVLVLTQQTTFAHDLASHSLESEIQINRSYGSLIKHSNGRISRNAPSLTGSRPEEEATVLLATSPSLQVRQPGQLHRGDRFHTQNTFCIHHTSSCPRNRISISLCSNHITFKSVFPKRLPLCITVGNC